MVEIKNFTMEYTQGVKAVDNLSLTIEDGDIFGFIGHNGAGKSTTIKALVGVLDYEIGEMTIEGHSVKNEPLECKKLTAYIPDNPDLYEHLTGIQYLNFVSDVFGLSEEVRTRRITRYADMFEITSSLGDVISSYSHGMKQKVAIIGALIHEPKFFVLDEPFVGLDPKATLTLKNIMRERCKEGCSVFFSTHVLDVAEKLCNKVAIIKKGSLVTTGTMEEIKGNKSLEDVFMEVEG